MRVFKALDLVPKRFELFVAVGFDFTNSRLVVYKLALTEYRNEKLARGKVGYRLSFPGEVRVKELERLFFVDCFVVDADVVGDCFAR